MEEIVAKIFSCNWQTYKLIYKDAVERAFKKEGIKISPDNIKVKIIDLSDNGKKLIQSQRSANGPHCRTISVYVDDQIKYIIGLSNTNYDEDIRQERRKTGRNDVYGSDGYHANTYLLQGINKIFDSYFESKKTNENVKLFFYLLDTDRTYPSNKFNLFTYRLFSTLGFDVLNLDCISFDEFKDYGFYPNAQYSNIAYQSFNKLMNDKLAISSKNTSNIPSYLKCVEEVMSDGTISTEKYIYTFKTLGAQGYDSFLMMWTLSYLAKKEHKNLEFLFSTERYGFRVPNRTVKVTKELTGPVKKLLTEVGISIHFATSDEILQEYERDEDQFLRAKKNNDIRNQLLFRNNIRSKGIQTKCAICGCEIESLLEAAHIWGIAEIKDENGRIINKIVTSTALKDLIDPNSPYKDDIFYKRYVLANSGDNGIWLCKNHHGLFDKHYYCFESEYGKILIRFGTEEQIKQILGIDDLESIKLDNSILTEKTKVFIEQRIRKFGSINMPL